MGKVVPLVLYIEGERLVVGEATIEEDGTVRGSIKNRVLTNEIMNYHPLELRVAPLPPAQFTDRSIRC